MAEPVIMIACRPGLIIDERGRRRSVKKGVTTAHSDHPVVAKHPRLWRPLEVTYPSPTLANRAADADEPTRDPVKPPAAARKRASRKPRETKADT